MCQTNYFIFNSFPKLRILAPACLGSVLEDILWISVRTQSKAQDFDRIWVSPSFAADTYVLSTGIHLCFLALCTCIVFIVSSAKRHLRVHWRLRLPHPRRWDECSLSYSEPVWWHGPDCQTGGLVTLEHRRCLSVWNILFRASKPWAVLSPSLPTPSFAHWNKSLPYWKIRPCQLAVWTRFSPHVEHPPPPLPPLNRH